MKRYNTAIFDNARWEGFEHRHDDIFVCTPPKCGTTWTQTIVVNLLFPDGDAPGPVMQLSPWIEAKWTSAEEMHAMLAKQRHRRVIKTHTPADGIPWFDDARYLFVCRDGRDAFMSFSNHVERMKITGMVNEQALRDGIPPMPDFDGDIHKFFDDWLSGTDRFFEIVASYWEKKSRPNLLFVHFNDLKRDLGAEMRRIADFLDIQIAADRWPEVIERCTFEHMREDEGMVGDMSGVFEGGTKGFLFKGTNGRWRDVLTDDELSRYEQRLGGAMPPEAAVWVANGRGNPGEGVAVKDSNAS